MSASLFTSTLWLSFISFFHLTPSLPITAISSDDGNYVMPEGQILLQADNASIYCQQEYGSQLASIHNLNQQQEAFNLCMFMFGPPSSSNYYGCTIGLNDKTTEKLTNPTGWQWFDGTDYDYMYWRTSAPVQPNGGADEDCVGLMLFWNDQDPGAGSWYDISCNAESAFQMGFICNMPPTNDPTKAPSKSTSNPSETPSKAPTSFTNNPSQTPSSHPSVAPTHYPTFVPTYDPTIDPTHDPTIEPTHDPSMEPTNIPTMYPSVPPTRHPSYYPTADPSHDPTNDPTYDPTQNPSIPPTLSPTKDPTKEGAVEEAISSTMDEDDTDKKGKKSSSGALTYVIVIFAVMCVVICVAVGLWIASCVGSKKKDDNTQVEINKNQNQNNIRSGEKKEEERDEENSEELYGPGDNPQDRATAGKNKKDSITESVDKKVNDEIEGERNPNGDNKEENALLQSSEGNIKVNVAENEQETDRGDNDKNDE